MKRLAVLGLILTCMALSLTARAATTSSNEDITAIITLDSLKAQDLKQNSEEQIYLAITEFKTGGNTQLTRVPKYPYALVVKPNAELGPMTLWENSLRQGETAMLLFQVVKQDLSVTDPDDVLSVAKLEIINQHGHLRSKWNIPGSDTLPAHKVTADAEYDTFTLDRNNGKYIFVFGVKTAAN